MCTQSMGGALYYVLFKDNCTRFRCVFHNKKIRNICLFQKVVKLNPKLYLDWNKRIYKWKVQFVLVGIRNQTWWVQCCLHPWTKSFIERDNIIIMEKTCDILHARSLPKFLWVKAIDTLVHVLNHTTTRMFVESTHYEQWIGNIPNISCFWVFGCFGFKRVEGTSNKIGSESTTNDFYWVCQI